MKKIIYFDQNIWIKLARVYYGETIDNSISNTCTNLINLSEQEKIIIPLSAAHMIETSHRRDQESRERLAKFMCLLSRTYTIMPYYCIRYTELKNAIMKRYNNSTINVKNMVIGKGISHMLGSKPSVQGAITNNSKITLTKEYISNIKNELDIPESLIDSLSQLVGKEITIGEFTDEIMNSNESFYLFLKGPRKSKKINKIEQKSIDDLEKIRILYKDKIKDKNLRYKAILGVNAFSIISKPFEEICIRMGLLPIEIIKEDWKEDDWMNFLQDIRTFYCQFHLMYGRDRDYNKPIHGHDLIDISSLAIAIPYCDLVVCEKRFGNIAKQLKLDQLYNTIILSSLNDLDKSFNFLA